MNEIPLYLFIFLMMVLFVLVLHAMSVQRISAVVSALMSVILAFTLSKISINGQLVQTFSGISAINTVVIDTIPIRIGWLSWVFAFIGVVMVVFTLLLLVTVYKTR